MAMAALLVAGCSSSRRSRTTDLPDAVGISKTFAYSDLFESNLSAHGFFIRKLRLNIDIGGTRDSYTANLRKSNDGKWLASVQLLGIEVIRIYADSESVIVLDRIGRNARVMVWERLEAEYGITYDLLPLLLGDIPEIARGSQREINCNVPTHFRKGNWKFDIISDCTIPRAKEIVLNVEPGTRVIEMKADEFRTTEEISYTSVISVREINGAFDVEMLINEIMVPWNGDIEFSIPTNYKVERK